MGSWTEKQWEVTPLIYTTLAAAVVRTVLIGSDVGSDDNGDGDDYNRQMEISRTDPRHSWPLWATGRSCARQQVSWRISIMLPSRCCTLYTHVLGLEPLFSSGIHGLASPRCRANSHGHRLE